MKNNGHIFAPSGPLHLQTMSSALKWMKRGVGEKQARPSHLREPARLPVKPSESGAVCEQLTGSAGCENVLLGIFCHMKRGPIVCTAPSLQGLVVPLSGDELRWGATSLAPSLNGWQLPFITASTLSHHHSHSVHCGTPRPLAP